MNKERRKEILSVAEELQTCVGTLETIKDAEDEARENLPENFQSGDRYSESEECSDILSDAVDTLTEMIGNLENI